jgi:predicted phosphodiesterase
MSSPPLHLRDDDTSALLAAPPVRLRLLVLSDLHLELPHPPYLPPPPETYDAVILAGDINLRNQCLLWAASTFASGKPVLFVPGNHEYYGRTTHEKFDAGITQYDNLWLLNPGALQIADVQFIGAKLWAEYELSADELISEQSIAIAQVGSDHRNIMDGGGRVQPGFLRNLHEKSLMFIGNNLTHGSPRKRVVITHHLPCAQSIDPKCADAPLNPAFASNLDVLVRKADLWIHGHTHASADYSLGGCRVVCNPAGYPRDNARENPDFNPNLIVEI